MAFLFDTIWRMRLLTVPLFLCLLVVCALAGSDLAGRFQGDWKSNGTGSGGRFHMNLEERSGAWKCEVTFIFGDSEIKTKNCAAKVDSSRLEASYDFDLAGNMLRSKIAGKWNGDGFEGDYHTTTADGASAVDEGTWMAVRGK